MFKDEFEMNMRLLGSRTIREIVPEMVDASNIHIHTVPVPIDNLYEGNCASFRLIFFSHFHSAHACLPTRFPFRKFFPHSFSLNHVEAAG